MSRNMGSRLDKLEERAGELPPPRRAGVVVPTDSLAAFARGLITGAFGPADIDTGDYLQMNHFATLNAALVTFTPKHQRWCDESGWGRKHQDEWERANLGELTADELAALKRLGCQLAELRESDSNP